MKNVKTWMNKFRFWESSNSISKFINLRISLINASMSEENTTDPIKKRAIPMTLSVSEMG